MAPTCKRASICSTWLASSKATLASRADAAACKQKLLYQQDFNLYKILIYIFSFIFQSFPWTNLALGHHHLVFGPWPCWVMSLGSSHKGNEKQLHGWFNIRYMCTGSRGHLFQRSVKIQGPDGVWFKLIFGYTWIGCRSTASFYPCLINIQSKQFHNNL